MHGINFIHGMGGGALLLAGAIVMGCFIYAKYIRKSDNADKRDSLEILKRRLASGDITMDEFNSIREVL